MFAVLWLLQCYRSENLILQNNEMYSYIGLLLSVPMAASPAPKMLWAVTVLCIQCLQQLDFLLHYVCESETTANKRKLTAFYS